MYLVLIKDSAQGHPYKTWIEVVPNIGMRRTTRRNRATRFQLLENATSIARLMTIKEADLKGVVVEL